MNYISIYHPNFNSNIYVYRQNLSHWLSRFVDVRANVGTFILSPSDIRQIDVLLQMYHYKFEDVKRTIDTLEKDTYVYGA